MYVVTRDGKKLPVDDSELDYKKNDVYVYERGVLCTEEATLKPFWLVTIMEEEDIGGFYNKRNGREVNTEFVAELFYAHKPTKEDIMYALGLYGTKKCVFAIIDKCYRPEED